MDQAQSSRQREVFELAQAREALLNRKAEIVRGMPEWKPEVWATLKEADRWATLEKTEKSFAALERRDPVPVRPLSQDVVDAHVKDGNPPPHGRLKEQYGNPLELQIYRKFVLETEPNRAMLAYFHEEHHIEQLQAVRSPESRPDFTTARIEAWKGSLDFERVVQYKRDISHDEYKSFAHEQGSQLEAARLYARCLNDAPAASEREHVQRTDQQPIRDAADPKAVQEAKRQEALDALTRLNQERVAHEQKNTPARDPER